MHRALGRTGAAARRWSDNTLRVRTLRAWPPQSSPGSPRCPTSRRRRTRASISAGRRGQRQSPKRNSITSPAAQPGPPRYEPFDRPFGAPRVSAIVAPFEERPLPRASPRWRCADARRRRGRSGPHQRAPRCEQDERVDGGHVRRRLQGDRANAVYEGRRVVARGTLRSHEDHRSPRRSGIGVAASGQSVGASTVMARIVDVLHRGGSEQQQPGAAVQLRGSAFQQVTVGGSAPW
jgi:hypothetical protein